LAEAPSFGKSIFQYAPDSHGAEDYHRLAEEIAANGGPADASHEGSSSKAADSRQ
jgi:cellulose biosynthesis protein BcsQ